MSTLILSCSPKKIGNSVSVCNFLQTQLLSMGHSDVQTISLTKNLIFPCTDCGQCKTFPHNCAFDEKDNVKELFKLCDNAEIIICVTPIYFYHVPSQFKAFIDRSQKYWYIKQSDKNKVEIKKNLYGIYISAREKGEKLASGIDYTLKYFAPQIQAKFIESTCLYGLENPSDFQENSFHSTNALEKLNLFLLKLIG